MTRQLSLFDRPHRVVPPADPGVAPEARPRLSRQCLAILARLREGPAYASDLTPITHRFGGRIYDLRRAGCTIRCDHLPESGIAVYHLTHEPEGLR